MLAHSLRSAWRPAAAGLATRFVAVLATALLAPAGTAQGCLDQVYEPTFNNGLEVTRNQSVAQTFTAGRAGVLAQIDIVGINHHRGVSTDTLEVAIVPTDTAGVPMTTKLASVVLQPSAIPTSRGTVSVDLRSFAIPVAQGQVLGIWLQSQGLSPGPTYAWWGDAPGNYPAGSTFIGPTTRLTWDLGFRSYLSVPAVAQTYGSGFAGSLGVPTLTASAPPTLATTIQLQIGSSAPSSAMGVLLVGASPANLPTPLGGTLLVQVLFGLSVAVPPGGASLPVAIPFDPSACGSSVYLQAAMLDPGAVFGVSFTPGLQLLLGL